MFPMSVAPAISVSSRASPFAASWGPMITNDTSGSGDPHAAGHGEQLPEALLPHEPTDQSDHDGSRCRSESCTRVRHLRGGARRTVLRQVHAVAEEFELPFGYPQLAHHLEILGILEQFDVGTGGSQSAPARRRRPCDVRSPRVRRRARARC